MERFTWLRMEQNAPHNARESGGSTCSILHHEKRFMSHSPYIFLLISYIIVSSQKMATLGMPENFRQVQTYAQNSARYKCTA